LCISLLVAYLCHIQHNQASALARIAILNPDKFEKSNPVQPKKFKSGKTAAKATTANTYHLSLYDGAWKSVQQKSTTTFWSVEMLVNQFNNECITDKLPIVHFLLDALAELRTRPHNCTQHVTCKTQ